MSDRYRVGKHYGIHVYQGDRPVATFADAPEAAKIVDLINARPPTTVTGDAAKVALTTFYNHDDAASVSAMHAAITAALPHLRGEDV